MWKAPLGSGKESRVNSLRERRKDRKWGMIKEKLETSIAQLAASYNLTSPHHHYLRDSNCMSGVVFCYRPKSRWKTMVWVYITMWEYSGIGYIVESECAVCMLHETKPSPDFHPQSTRGISAKALEKRPCYTIQACRNSTVRRDDETLYSWRVSPERYEHVIY